jgi:endoglucanase
MQFIHRPMATAICAVCMLSITSCGGDTGSTAPEIVPSSQGVNANKLSANSLVNGGIYTLRSACSDKFLDIQQASSADGAKVQIWRSNNGGTNQQFKLQEATGGYVSLIAQHSGKALDVYAAGTADRTPVIQWSNHGGANQLWQAQVNNDGSYTFISKSAGKALDVQWAGVQDGTAVQIWPANGTCAQRWILAAQNGTDPSANAPVDAFAMQRALGRGVNFGDILDPPTEGQNGFYLTEDLFDKAKSIGVQAIRMPVRWSNHALATAPFTIDEKFFARVDFAISAALARGMKIIINMHHYRQLDGEPLHPGEFAVSDAVLEDRFIAMWRQIAARYKDQPVDRVLFELYNEPHGAMTDERWNRLLARTLAEVRQNNPTRYIVIGPGGYNSAWTLKNLQLPADDRRIIVTVHNYEPFNFTHQQMSGTGLENSGPVSCCSVSQLKSMFDALDEAQRWGKANNRPLWVGEFGANTRSPYSSRVDYARQARDAIEARGMTWSWWQFVSNFGFYDPGNQAFQAELRDALMK